MAYAIEKIADYLISWVLVYSQTIFHLKDLLKPQRQIVPTDISFDVQMMTTFGSKISHEFFKSFIHLIRIFDFSLVFQWLLTTFLNVFLQTLNLSGLFTRRNLNVLLQKFIFSWSDFLMSLLQFVQMTVSLVQEVVLMKMLIVFCLNFHLNLIQIICLNFFLDALSLFLPILSLLS